MARHELTDQRWVRLVNKLKVFQRIATRYEKRTVHYFGMLTIASIVLWS